MQYIEFLEGRRPKEKVWFSKGNHPFTGELVIGISLLLQGKGFKAPSNPWRTNLTIDQLIAARSSALLLGLTGLRSIIFISLRRWPLVAIPAGLLSLPMSVFALIILSIDGFFLVLS